MRQFFVAIVLFVSTALAVVVWALPGEPKAPALECHLRDGSVLLIEPTDATFVINTKYGSFTVPLADVVKLEPAIPRSAELDRDILKWMDELGSPQFAVREKAQTQLLDHADVAYPQLKSGLRSDIPEVAKRCETILRLVAKKVNDETFQDRSVDMITTTDLTILRGKLESTSINVKSKSLGELTIQLANVKCFGKPTEKAVLRPTTPPTAYYKGKGAVPLPDLPK
jgi:hypothetical protein